MISEAPEPQPSVEGDSVNATRLASGVATRSGGAPARDREETRIAHGRGLADLETEGARIRHRSPATRPTPTSEREGREQYQIGERIGGRYEVLAIHRGTMGVVYGTFDHQEQLPRALKTLQVRHAGDKRMRDLFVAEALTWVKLEKHPFIVRAYLIERFNDQPYVITEYIRGQEDMGGDLRAWLGHPKLTLQIAVEISLQIAQGMQHAVRKVPGLIHRDLKPANILVDERMRAMVTDFGLVNSEDAGAGTPAYMAPEQWMGESLDSRTDIYAYGCILYEMFTGHRMYAAQSEDEWEASHLTQQPPAPISIEPTLPPEISAFIVRCLSKERSSRPAGWDEVVLECAHWFHEITGQPVVFDFSAVALSVDELISASYSMARLNKYPEMLTVCDRTLALEPENVSAWGNRAAALNGLGRYQEGLFACDRAIQIQPTHVTAWVNRSSALNGLRRFQEMISSCDEALGIDPAHSGAWYNKGLAQHFLNQNEEAVLSYGRSLDLEPSNFDALLNLGSALTSIGRYDEAVTALDRAIEINSDNSYAWSAKGNALNLLQRHQEANHACDRAVSLDENNTRVWLVKAYALNQLERYDESILACEKALALNPADFRAWFNRGVALHSIKRYEQANSAFDHALSISSSPDAWAWKASTLHAIQQYEEANVAYDNALKTDPKNAYNLFAKARVLTCLGRHAEALASYERAALADPTFEPALRDRQKLSKLADWSRN
jgi:tetratricopeptide (TPR) repeat protein/serine/threonine protein kinase